MTIQSDVDKAAKGLKAAVRDREAAKLPPRQGEMHPSFVVGGKAIVVSIPWSFIQQKPEADIAKYLLERLK